MAMFDTDFMVRDSTTETRFDAEPICSNTLELKVLELNPQNGHKLNCSFKQYTAEFKTKVLGFN